jgi:hypothetical protein
MKWFQEDTEDVPTDGVWKDVCTDVGVWSAEQREI